MNKGQVDKEIRKKLEKDVIIPDIVNEKINTAYDIIRNIDVKGKDNDMKKKTIIKYVSCTAACALLIIGLGFGLGNTALADKIPFIENVFNLFRSDSSLNYKENFAKGNQGDYAETVNVNSSNKDIDITIQDIYCDGNSIFTTYIAEVKNNKFSDSETLTLDRPSIKINGKKIDMMDTLILKRLENNTFVGMHYLSLMYYDGDITDKLNVDINISKIIGSYNAYLKGTVTNAKIKGNWSFNLDVKNDTSRNNIFEPNIENNGVILKKVSITPGTTEIEVDIPHSMGPSAYMLAHDSAGNKLSPVLGQGFPSEIGTLQHKVFESSTEDIEYIIIKIVDKSTQDLTQLAEFKVDLK
ncbi:DUF4179 domain-containing protein [Clostridium sp. UBA6640]|uniref:DUF4179 domain-containing protein n=1 Tax=Clostridium sp. UBA6640 TaxID=1946370 RepID=UPI0025BD7D15|nr:DUF4179 domain-containing protein [Clostridium sp. UBA6640]